MPGRHPDRLRERATPSTTLTPYAASPFSRPLPEPSTLYTSFAVGHAYLQRQGSSSPQKIRETLGKYVADPFEPLVHRQCMSTQLPRTAHGVICAHLEDVGR